MYLLALAVLLVLLKILGVSPIGDWSWWGVLLPFPLVAIWWAIADASGLTKKRADEREEARRLARMRKIVARHSNQKGAR